MAEQSVKQITLTIDGKPVMAPEGTTVLQACEQAGSPVPFYCYHPGLSIAGNCRICLVDIEGSPKLQIACYTPVAEGMKVQTTSDKALVGRRDVLEFLLINHPLDCPVCDQAGECWLQDYYMQHGLYDPKFDETKNKKPKAVPIGPTVMLDAERCIPCSRCVRFTDEITKTGEFGIFQRGDHAEIGLHPGKPLDNNYAGNVVDICPVGALTDRDFRFKCRVWYLGTTNSVCPGCARGCNIQIHSNREREWRPHIAKGERVMRLKPRYNPDVNQWWMCDEGRYGYHAIDERRLAHVQLREGHALRPGTWEEAFSLMGGALARLRQSKQLDQVGVLLSSHLTNEDLYAAKRVFGQLGVSQVVFQRPPPGQGDALLLQADKSPNARGAQALGIREGAEGLLAQALRKQLRVLFVLTQDLTVLFGEERVREAAAALELLVFQGPHMNQTAELAHLVLPSAVYAEKGGTFTNFEGRVQRIHAALEPWGESKPDWEILAALASRLSLPAIAPDAPAIFAELAEHEPSFQGLTYERIGDQGALLRSGEVAERHSGGV
ncbi:MAG: molybdopterin-dependent oxidoreductase [Candidatus Omnitrophica bacterium]|nr:molybdopterin-dependent oxidoreductase [Candidatus Omnitrophota bacterium]